MSDWRLITVRRILLLLWASITTKCTRENVSVIGSIVRSRWILFPLLISFSVIVPLRSHSLSVGNARNYFFHLFRPAKCVPMQKIMLISANIFSVKTFLIEILTTRGLMLIRMYFKSRFSILRERFSRLVLAVRYVIDVSNLSAGSKRTERRDDVIRNRSLTQRRA